MGIFDDEIYLFFQIHLGNGFFPLDYLIIFNCVSLLLGTCVLIGCNLGRRLKSVICACFIQHFFFLFSFFYLFFVENLDRVRFWIILLILVFHFFIRGSLYVIRQRPIVEKIIILNIDNYEYIGYLHDRLCKFHFQYLQIHINLDSLPDCLFHYLIYLIFLYLGLLNRIHHYFCSDFDFHLELKHLP